MLETIQTILKTFSAGDLSANALSFFKALGYASERQQPLDEKTFAGFSAYLNDEMNFNEKNALVQDWHSVDLLFQLTESELNEQQIMFKGTGIDDRITSYLFFAIELTNDNYSRTALSQITREVNKVFQIPVMVLFKYGELLTLAIIDRQPHLRDEAKDVLRKVTLIKDIRVANPHRAHLEILEDLSLPKLSTKFKLSSFLDLHQAWQKVLDTKELNKRFFKELANWYFQAVDNVTFPADEEKDEAVRNATSIIRLITRLMFVWFLKEKGLVSEKLFDEKYLRIILNSTEKPPAETGTLNDSTYYKAILQNLFFATLNSNMGERKFIAESSGGRNNQHFVHNVFRYQQAFKTPEATISELFEPIPFLNGGLFECLDKETDAGRIRVDGFSDHPKNVLRVPDELFFGPEHDVDLNEIYGTKNKKYKVRGLINLLNSYKFTIAENTPIEEEIALDPELLGKVFENLLANYNPETRTTARKQTGSFYTSREIVNYMVDESLIAYLTTKLQTETVGFESFTEIQPTFFGNDMRVQQVFEIPVSNSRWQSKGDELEAALRELLSYHDKPHQFTATETEILIKAIDNCKILDPACGSGAFPMGILLKLVHLLEKLDPDNAKWREWQKLKAIEETKTAYDIGDKQERENRLKEINDIFADNSSDYGRKLFLIENCIYGVDIQPVAIQIAKLRFFISLIVDQKFNNDPAHNRGIRPLPNLETKFVAANTLIGLEMSGLKPNGMAELEKELKEIRAKHFGARTRKTKEKYRTEDKRLRGAIAELLKQAGLPETSANQISNWNPYDQNAKADWFDAEWMFGIEKGFDIVIGNPPYGAKFSKIEIDHFLRTYKHQDYQLDSYLLFTEQCLLLANYEGIISLIIPNTWLINVKLKKIRKFIVTNNTVINISHYIKGVFDAVVDTSVVILRKSPFVNNKVRIRIVEEADSIKHLVQSQQKWKELNGSPINIFLDKRTTLLISKINNISKPLITFCNVVVGMKPYQTGKGKPKQTPEIVARRIFDATSKVDQSYRAVLRGSDIEKYVNKWSGNRWIKFGSHLAEPRYSANFDAAEKIVIRQTGDSLIATIDDSQFICMNNMHVITLKNTDGNLRFILALLNSKILDFYHQFLNPERGEALAEIKNENVGKLPIPNATAAQQAAIAGLVEKILAAKKTGAQASRLPAASAATAQRSEEEKVDEESNPLRRAATRTRAEASETLALQSDTLQSDALQSTALQLWEAEIDVLVYELYGLTPEEIAIVEGR